MIINRILNRIKFCVNNYKFGAKGKNCRVIKPMRIIGKKNMYLGNNVTILNSARIEAICEWHGEKYSPKIVINDGVSIEQSCHIIAADELIIERDVVISAFVYIADCQERFDQRTRIMESDLDVKKTRIKEGAFIGIGARIMPGVTIGAHSVVGANAVVTKSIPDYQIWAGVPARYIRDNTIME